ncbi:MAG: SUMF1/EgtB/PvdO family nonheme iron enzyme [Planctomycetaceae bacterium]
MATPFIASNTQELIGRIATVSAKPPRSINDAIPQELERICLKALANQTSARYTTGLDFAEDLRACIIPPTKSSAVSTPSASPSFVAPSQSTLQGLTPAARPAVVNDAAQVPTPARLIPRGLRSFTAEDSAFFIDLLPGPRTRGGLPESIAFWKARIEEQDVTKTFSVGLIYGPSGCGKSSLVKAGLLPNLTEDLIAVYIEASATETEERLCRALRSRIDTIRGGSVVELLTEIRRNRGRKVLIVLDQFEQWLHANPVSIDEPLVRALRQCDGGQLQAVLMIRDDFFVSVSRLMQTLDLRILQGSNCAMVDLFDTSHAEAVLIKLGAAYGKLPTNTAELGHDQQQFIHSAVQELSESKKVISVRLTLFAQMVRSELWTPHTLAEIGGAGGVGVAFLEETFSSPRSDVRYRRHLPAVRAILRALLPLMNTEIKGSSRTSEELQIAAEHQTRGQDFAELLYMLDAELRLITPTEALLAPDPPTNPHSPSYQLSHDYLVPSIREWLTCKQKETATGRAELKLEDRTTLYTSRPEPRYLPGFLDWLQILLLVRRRRWTSAETAVMRAAGRRHLICGTTIATVLLAAGLVLQFLLEARALDGLAGQIQNANPSGLTQLLDEADKQGPVLDERLRPIIQAADEPAADAATKLAAVPARLVVVVRDESQLHPLQDALLTGELTYVAPIRNRLRQFSGKLRPQWLELMRNPAEPAARRFRAALGVVGLDGEQASTDWTDAEINFIATELSTSFAEHQPLLRELLRPISGQLVPVLDRLFDADTSTTDQQISTALALADFAGNDPERLARLLTRATARQTEILYPKVADCKSGPIRDGLLALTREQPDVNLGQLARVSLGRRRANAAITLLRQGEREAYFNALRITDDPESLSQFAHRCRSWGVTPQELLESFDRSATLRQTATGAARRLESRVMYGLLIALGSYPLDQIPDAAREAVFAKLRALYEGDPSAAVHSASGWLLRTWGRETDVAKLDEVEVPYDASGEREWFRLRVGVLAKSSGPFAELGLPGTLQRFSLTFVVFPAGEYRLGSPEFEGGELERQLDELPRMVKVTQPFALCDREVTWELYEAFAGEKWRTVVNEQFHWDLNVATSACSVNWFEWIQFCRWLTSEYYGADERWQCYPDPTQLEKDGDGNPRVGRLLAERSGFRMPTESEWEVGARAGQRTAYTFGSDASLLDRYGWFVENSVGRRPQISATKPPGPGGLHDVQGNLFEWVHDWYDMHRVVAGPQGLPDGRIRISSERRFTPQIRSARLRSISRCGRGSLLVRCWPRGRVSLPKGLNIPRTPFPLVCGKVLPIQPKSNLDPHSPLRGKRRRG